MKPKMDPTGVVTVISLLSAVGEKPALLHAWRKNELVDGKKTCLRYLLLSFEMLSILILSLIIFLSVKIPLLGIFALIERQRGNSRKFRM